MLTHAGLFSGIGGFSLAAEWMGWQNVFEVELDPFCRQVLHKNFPHSQLFEDVCTFDGLPFRGRIDILSGGFPCQPWSDAGQKLGTADPRHLWPQFLRIIREIRPRLVVGENVRGLLSWGAGLQFEAVCADLEAEGYTVLPLLLPAASVGAPHKRDRFWFVAYARCGAGNRGQGAVARNDFDGKETQRQEGAGEHQRLCQARAAACGSCNATDTSGQPLQRRGECRILAGESRDTRGKAQEWERGRDAAADSHQATGHPHGAGLEVRESQPSDNGPEQPAAIGADWRLTEPPLCSPNDGVPTRLVRTASPRAKQLKAYGNAIVPQVAYQIFKAIEASL